MFLVTVAIEWTAEAVSPVLDPNLVVQALNAEMTPENGLEHVSARAGPHGMYVGIFCRAPDHETAEKRAHRVCRKALASRSTFIGWRLVDGNS